MCRNGTTLRSLDFLSYYGKLKAAIDRSTADAVPQMSEEEREIEDLIDSIKSAKKKVIKDGTLYKYNGANSALPKLTGAGVVLARKGMISDERKAFQILGLEGAVAAAGEKPEQNTDQELNAIVRSAEAAQKRYVYASSVGRFAEARELNNYIPTTSLF